jgi:hypothetical protein
LSQRCGNCHIVEIFSGKRHTSTTFSVKIIIPLKICSGNWHITKLFSVQHIFERIFNGVAPVQNLLQHFQLPQKGCHTITLEAFFYREKMYKNAKYFLFLHH